MGQKHSKIQHGVLFNSIFILLQTNVGPIVLAVNSHRDIGNPLNLTSVTSTSPELSKVVNEALRLQNDTKYPQAIIVSGRSGSGKSHVAMKLLRHLNQDSDAFKYLSAAITVLRSLGSAQTTSNRESSRIGHFIEAQISEGELYRTKINCYFLDQVNMILRVNVREPKKIKKSLNGQI